MHLFTDYIEPLTAWLYTHPHWALIITFLIALTESLAIVGSIIPGSVTMTAIGILAGSGVMRIDLTLLAATLGAIAGDSSSYLLGYAFSDRLVSIWPFSRYPNWLFYGKDYFARHGGKSVLVGRFIGPLRSIIPVIAGMMHMSHWRFFIANALSAIAWAIIYVTPGVLIGAASSELSPESATRLFVLILVLLASIWLLSVGLKWLFIRINRLLRSSLHDFWSWSSTHPHWAKFFKLVTPAYETNYYPTAALVMLLGLSTLLFLILAALVMHGDWISVLNSPTHLFMQSLRTHAFDVFFIVVSQIVSPLTLITLILTVTALTVYAQDWRSLTYWLSLNLFCTLILLAVHLLIHSPRPQDLLEIQAGNSFPTIELTYATALFSSLIFYMKTYYPGRLNGLFKIILSLSLLLAGLASIYLGDNWFTDNLGAYLCGFSLSLSHWLFYRRQAQQVVRPFLVPAIILVSLFLGSMTSCLLTYNKSIRSHQPYFAQYVFTDELWWNQRKPLLPMYRTNRIGQRISLFNIQYAGSLVHFTNALTAFGWKKQHDSLFNSILTRVSGQGASAQLPLMAQLYLNRKPVLVMTYQPNDGNPMQILRIWRSNYHLHHFHQPLWLGSVHPRNPLKPHELKQMNLRNKNKPNSLIYVSSALPQFLQRQLPLPVNNAKKQLPIVVEPILLLIRESTGLEFQKENLH